MAVPAAEPEWVYVGAGPAPPPRAQRIRQEELDELLWREQVRRWRAERERLAEFRREKGRRKRARAKERARVRAEEEARAKAQAGAGLGGAGQE